MPMMNLNIATLLRAAEYLEKREREAEHGYASSVQQQKYDLKQLNTTIATHATNAANGISISRDRELHKLPKLKKSQGNRPTHNELEKNRRAHLRSCLERLKELVPLSPESNRHTTLGLLNKAKSFIKSLEEKERRQNFIKEELLHEQRYLYRKLASLKHDYRTQTHNRLRSISESSSGISSTSTSPVYETDESDVMGFTSSNPSDTDDQSSVQSISSDGGVTIIMKRLVVEPPNMDISG